LQLKLSLKLKFGEPVSGYEEENQFKFLVFAAKQIAR
jgi:hypothetical protein